MVKHEIRRQRGFTLVEVSLALIFVAVIIAVLAATTVNITRSYNKGIWLSQINQAGQQLNTDIGDKARYSAVAKVDNEHRRLCISGVSYLWNTESDLDSSTGFKNTYSDSGSDYSLVRVEDPNSDYCADPTLMPSSSDDSVRTLLARGAAIQAFDVIQGVTGSGDAEENSNIPLLTVSTVISTEGANRPVRVYSDGSGLRIDANGTRSDSSWQCGDWYDDGDTPGKVDNNDHFEAAENQYCSFAEYNITVYERSRQR